MIQPDFDSQEITDRLYPFTATRSVADIRMGILTIGEKWKSHRDMPAGSLLHHPWHIFLFNGLSICQDFERMTAGRRTQPVPDTVTVINPASVFIEEGAQLHHCLLNATAGPIYIGKNAQIMEGSFIRGPFALCEGAVVKMGTRIYGATTVGPHCIVGGEIKNAVLFGYSNKAHDGYLGDSVIGEWCNLGAGTSNSNLKNNADEIKVWDQYSGTYINAGTKCGLLMGDYSRAAINTSFNTGTVTGVCANVFGQGLTPRHIPDFSWGYTNTTRYTFDNAVRDIGNWKKLKNCSISEAEVRRLKHIFDRITGNQHH